MTHEYNQVSKEYRRFSPRWVRVSDVVRSNLKEKCEDYIPRINPHDKSQRNSLAYDNYVKRSVFYNFTKPTQATIIGSMFTKEPKLEVSGLGYIEHNIDGSGISVLQQARDVARELTETSRGGFLVDYTATEAAENRRVEQEINARPIAIFYKASSIIDWKTSVINHRRVLDKVVLAEWSCDSIVMHDRERVIYLDENNNCRIDLYKYKDGELEGVEESEPKNYAGQSLKYLPFQFVGGLNNDESIDDAMLYDLAELNIAHFQSSADYEDFRFKLGQIQPVITGISSAWAEKNGGTLNYGSGSAWVLPENASASLLQATPNSANMESMLHKEEQAKAIGAKLLSPNGRTMTATEADIISSSESASIVTIVSNMEDAYRNVFEMMLDRVQSGSVSIEFNRTFATSNLSPDEMRVLMEGIFKGVIPDTVLFRRMRQAGMVKDETTDDDLRAELNDSTFGTGLNGS